MSRLRQKHAQNYTSTSNINSEFEHVVRYINSAELGNKTLLELMEILFDEDGEFDAPIEIRRDSSAGIQYRIGEYSTTEEGWITIAALSEIRGEPGADVGTLGDPVFLGRSDAIASASQDEFDYAHEATDDLVVFLDGVLQREGGGFDFTSNPTGGTGSAGSITFNTPLTGGELVTIYKVRTNTISGYNRQDTLTLSDQVVFPYVHDDSSQVLVFKNGILQREGGSYDYVADPVSDTITFTSTVTTGNLVTIMTVENVSANAVTGMMFEQKYVDPATGLILYPKIQIADGAIPQAKVASLSTDLAGKADMVISATTPVSPNSGDLWMDTSVSPALLKFFDGSDWNLTAPESVLPSFSASDAAKYVRINGTGTAIVYENIDFSSLVPLTQKGAANGVASLDSNGRLPVTQLPSVLAADSFYHLEATPSNATYVVKRVFGQLLSITGLALQTSSGTCDVQVAVNGVGVGSVYSVSSTPTEFALGTTIDIDSTSASDVIGFIVTNNSASANLEVTMAVNIISS